MKYETKKEILCVDTGETICIGDIVNIENIDGGGCGRCRIVKITDTGFHFNHGKSNKSTQYRNIKRIDKVN